MIIKKTSKGYYELWDKHKFIKHIGNEAAYQKHLKKERELNALLGKDKVSTPDFPQSKFEVIYADPPWQYEFSETISREIENQYDTLTLKQICRLKDMNKVKVQDIIADNAVLFLWATAPKLQEALKAMNTWGFEYKTHAVWDKGKIGMGYWFRGQHELLLVGTKGNFSPPSAEARISSVIRKTRTEHSLKPSGIHDIIESMFPKMKYVELFARQPYNDKWVCWGNEISDSAQNQISS